MSTMVLFIGRNRKGIIVRGYPTNQELRIQNERKLGRQTRNLKNQSKCPVMEAVRNV